VLSLLLLFLVVVVLLSLVGGQEGQRLVERLVLFAQVLPQALEQLGLLLGCLPVAVLKGGPHGLPRHPGAVALGRGLGHQAVPAVTVLIDLQIRQGEQLLEGTGRGRPVDLRRRRQRRGLEPLAAGPAATHPPTPAPAPAPRTTGTVAAGGAVPARALPGNGGRTKHRRGQEQQPADAHAKSSGE